MNDIEKKHVLKQFMVIPGVGKSIAEDLWAMGYRSVSELRTENPSEMYDRISRLYGVKMDRCMLYVFRCAVYYASENHPDPELLKWWNWKDRLMNCELMPVK